MESLEIKVMPQRKARRNELYWALGNMMSTLAKLGIKEAERLDNEEPYFPYVDRALKREGYEKL